MEGSFNAPDMSALFNCVNEKNVTQLKILIQQSPHPIEFGYLAFFYMILNRNWYNGARLILKTIPGLDVNVWRDDEWSTLSRLIDRGDAAYDPIILLLLEYNAKIDHNPPNCSRRYKTNAHRWEQKHNNAIEKCKRACYTILWVIEKMSFALKEPLKMVTRMILKTKLKRYWKYGGGGVL